MSEYDEQAAAFLASTGAKIKVEYVETAKYFPDDKEIRDIYNVTISKGGREYTFRFGNSINNSGKYHTISPGAKRANGGNTVIPPRVKYFYNVRDLDYKLNPNYCPPSAYLILSAVQKYDVGTFENFCADFGYDTDSRTAEKTYHAVVNEYTHLCTLFSAAEMERMQEIQ